MAHLLSLVLLVLVVAVASNFQAEIFAVRAGGGGAVARQGLSRSVLSS